MNKKKIIISSICIFVLSFFFHFIYDIFPSEFFAIFFPVNESIWEHMKLLYTSILFFGFVISFYQLINHKEIHLFGIWISACISIPIYLALYLPLHYTIGHNMIIAIVLLFLVILITQILFEKYKRKENKKVFFTAIIGIVLSYIAFGYLTYQPPMWDLFYDSENQSYGLHYYSL